MSMSIEKQIVLKKGDKFKVTFAANRTSQTCSNRIHCLRVSDFRQTTFKTFEIIELCYLFWDEFTGFNKDNTKGACPTI